MSRGRRNAACLCSQTAERKYARFERHLNGIPAFTKDSPNRAAWHHCLYRHSIVVLTPDENIVWSLAEAPQRVSLAPASVPLPSLFMHSSSRLIGRPNYHKLATRGLFLTAARGIPTAGQSARAAKLRIALSFLPARLCAMAHTEGTSACPFNACARPDAAAAASTSYGDVSTSFWLSLDQLPIAYSDAYNIRFFGIEKLHPFDSCKFQKVGDCATGRLADRLHCLHQWPSSAAI